MSRMCVEVGFIRVVEIQKDIKDKTYRVLASTDKFRDYLLIGEWELLEDALRVFSEWCERIEEQGDGE